MGLKPGDIMDCERCGRDATLNRVIVDVGDRSERVGYCNQCETETFGTVLRRGSWCPTDRCVLCTRDGMYALATVQLSVEGGSDGTVTKTRTYEIDDSTPHVCDEHFYYLVGREPEQRYPLANSL